MTKEEQNERQLFLKQCRAGRYDAGQMVLVGLGYLQEALDYIATLEEQKAELERDVKSLLPYCRRD